MLVHERLELLQPVGYLLALLVKEVSHGQSSLVAQGERAAYTARTLSRPHSSMASLLPHRYGTEHTVSGESR